MYVYMERERELAKNLIQVFHIILWKNQNKSLANPIDANTH